MVLFVTCPWPLLAGQRLSYSVVDDVAQAQKNTCGYARKCGCGDYQHQRLPGLEPQYEFPNRQGHWPRPPCTLMRALHLYCIEKPEERYCDHDRNSRTLSLMDALQFGKKGGNIRRNSRRVCYTIFGEVRVCYSQKEERAP